MLMNQFYVLYETHKHKYDQQRNGGEKNDMGKKKKWYEKKSYEFNYFII